METAAPTTSHRFELAGLGRAPFRFVGVYESKFQAVPGDPNCPVKPGASCDYCAAAIMVCCQIRSADGRTFKVGSDCVRKVGDAGLRKVIDRAIAERNRLASHARDDAKIAAAVAKLEAVREELARRPHPDAVHAARGRTALDFVAFMLKNAGRKGKVEAARLVLAVEVAS